MNKKRKTWKSKLTKRELRHLRVVAGVTTKASLAHNFNEQVKMRNETRGEGIVEPCFECKSIAIKLGMAV